MRILIHILFAIVIFLILMALNAVYNRVTSQETTKARLVIMVFLSLIISGLGGYITNPITEAVTNTANKIADRAESEYVENKYFELTHYNRGYYTGYVLNGKPEGEGILVYPNDDEHSYSITIGDTLNFPRDFSLNEKLK